MKSRKLELETMEERTAPANLITCAPPAGLMIHQVSGVVATPQPAPTLTAVTTQTYTVDKLATNHNETLVRDGRSRKRLRR
jgi:hypothetical protein